jgi:hypothetical protein
LKIFERLARLMKKYLLFVTQVALLLREAEELMAAKPQG